MLVKHVSDKKGCVFFSKAVFGVFCPNHDDPFNLKVVCWV